MVLALPEILLLCGFIVALGLIYSGKAYVDFFAWAVHKIVGKVPIIGNWISGKLTGVLQQLSNKMGSVAEGIGGQIARHWHFLTTIVDRLGWTIFHNAVAIQKLWWQIAYVHPLDVLWKRAREAFDLARSIAHALPGLRRGTVTVIREVARPGSTALGNATKTVTQPLRRELTAFERATAHRLAVMAAAVADLGGQVAGWPHAIGGAGVGSLRGIRTRLRSLEKATAGAGAAALVGAALAALGASWIRCRNWKRAGRQVCQMDADILSDLLGIVALIGGAVSLVELAKQVGGALDEITGVLGAVITDVDGPGEDEPPLHGVA